MNPLVVPMVMHVGLAAVLYGLLTLLRAPAVWGVGRSIDGANPWAAAERRVSANLSNQFEWPVFFHAACLLLGQLHAVDLVQTWLAWLFIAGRFAHSLIQILTTNVRLRGVVFTINFLAVLGMWIWLLVGQFGAAQ